MEKKKNNIIEKILGVFQKFEQIITILLSVVIALIIVIALIRLFQSFYELFVEDFFALEKIRFTDYQQLFGKIMTLLISLEFMASMLKVLKSHNLKNLIQDVVLITGLAIARKLIVLDYEKHDPASILALGGLFVSIGIFYFLVKVNIGKRSGLRRTED